MRALLKADDQTQDSARQKIFLSISLSEGSKGWKERTKKGEQGKRGSEGEDKAREKRKARTGRRSLTIIWVFFFSFFFFPFISIVYVKMPAFHAEIREVICNKRRLPHLERRQHVKELEPLLSIMDTKVAQCFCVPFTRALFLISVHFIRLFIGLICSRKS